LSTRARLAFITLVTTLLSGAAGLSGVVAATALVEREVDQHLQTVCGYALESVHRVLTRRAEDIRALALEPKLRSGHATRQEIDALLADYSHHFTGFAPYASISYFDMHRVRLADTLGQGLGTRHSASEYWGQLEDGIDSALKVAHSESLNEQVVHFAQVVKDEAGARIGVVVGRVRVFALRETVARPLAMLHVDEAVKADLLDRSGLTLFSNHAPETILAERSPYTRLVEDARRGGRRSGSLFARQSDEGEEITVFARGQPDTGALRAEEWALVVSVPRRAALAPLEGLRDRLLLAVAGIALLSLCASLLVLRAARERREVVPAPAT
jgi:hypothetical protein